MTQNNPLLPASADTSNQSNRSGTLRESVADTVSRSADALTGPDDDTSRALDAFSPEATLVDVPSPVVGGGTSGGSYYSPAEGREHIAGLFPGRDEAETAVAELERLGVSRSDISVVLRNPQESADFAAATGTESGSRVAEGAGAGSAIGGTVGAVLGALAAAATSIAIPGIGVLIAGPIAGALAGAGAGGLTGGLLGALVGAGIPEEHARHYEAGIQGGGVVVVADVPLHLVTQARPILQAHSRF